MDAIHVPFIPTWDLQLLVVDMSGSICKASVCQRSVTFRHIYGTCEIWLSRHDRPKANTKRTIHFSCYWCKVVWMILWKWLFLNNMTIFTIVFVIWIYIMPVVVNNIFMYTKESSQQTFQICKITIWIKYLDVPWQLTWRNGQDGKVLKY